MKFSYWMIVILVILAWPLYYLYQLQLGAISFLLLAVFFSCITVRLVKQMKKQKETGNDL